MMFSVVIPMSDHSDIDNTQEQLNITLKNLFAVARNKHIEFEVIIVNWNAIPELKTADMLHISDKPEGIAIRYMEVGYDLHNSYTLSHKIPFYTAHAVNAGIRRAQSDVIIKMMSGTFLLEETWNKLIQYINGKRYSQNLLTITSHAEFDREILKNYPDVYTVREEDLAEKCILKLEEGKVIDYRLKRIYQNREESFRRFDVLVFSKEEAEKVMGFPELSWYPTNINWMEVFFTLNLLKNVQAHFLWPEAEKIYYKPNLNAFNSANDQELKLAPDTERIVIARIQQEEAPVLFNDESWGLHNVDLVPRNF